MAGAEGCYMDEGCSGSWLAFQLCPALGYPKMWAAGCSKWCRSMNCSCPASKSGSCGDGAFPWAQVSLTPTQHLIACYSIILIRGVSC